MENRRRSGWTVESFRRRLEKVEGREEILLFVEELINERDELAARQEHLHSLARLFEKTVSDADDLSAQIKREAEETARAQAGDIMARAEERAFLLLQETKSQALLETQDEVSVMRATAERELQASFKGQAAEFQARVKEISERLHREMLVQAEECARRLALFEGELEKSLLCLPVPTIRQDVGEDPQSVLMSELEAAMANQPSSGENILSADTGQAEEDASQERLIEIEILPPRDKAAIDEISAHFNGLSEVAAVEVTHMTDRTVIHVLVLHPLDVVAELSGLQEVERAHQTKDDGPIKIEVVLAVRGELEREREALNMRARRLATRISRHD